MTQQTEQLPATQRAAPRIVQTDTSQFANLLDTGRFEHMWRVAQLFSKSKLVPEHFRNCPEDCFIGTQMAVRLGVDPLMFLQNTYVVHGRPGMQAQLAIALINSSGLFADSIDYEIRGDLSQPGYGVRAFARRADTDKIVYGPWITWAIVRAERWDAREGSKWKTIPELMFQYRAATWFGRLHCPERLMGMKTADELDDIGADSNGGATTVIDIDGKEIRPPKGQKAFLTKLKNLEGTESPPAGAGATPTTQPSPGASEDRGPSMVEVATDRSHPPGIDRTQNAASDDDPAHDSTDTQIDAPVAAGESQAPFPEPPDKNCPQGDFVSGLAGLCGIDKEAVAAALKTGFIKPAWKMASRETQVAWWQRFSVGKVAGLMPK